MGVYLSCRVENQHIKGFCDCQNHSYFSLYAFLYIFLLLVASIEGVLALYKPSGYDVLGVGRVKPAGHHCRHSVRWLLLSVCMDKVCV